MLYRFGQGCLLQVKEPFPSPSDLLYTSRSELISKIWDCSAQLRLGSVARGGDGCLAGVLCPDPERVTLLDGGGLGLLDIKTNMHQYVICVRG